ncbi:hypothetical protein ACFP3U_36160 [Kitasatospora misakiensis]|uniref:Secreted protein n=1 Tax=Kitasatospora misakiensis TaxID=67330 RepID=A0ABW0XCW3_9ACTN
MNDHTDPTGDRLAADLAAGLVALADAPAPVSRTDTAWVIRQGRSRLRRRRLGGLGAATAVVLGASVLGTALPDRTTAAPSSAAAGPTASSPVLPALGPDTGHDPLTVPAVFGWLPEGFDGVGYTIGFTGAPTEFGGKAYGPPQTGPEALPMNHQTIFLSVHPAGEAPPVGPDNLGRPQYRVDTRPVNGRPAYWLGRGPDDPTGTAGDYWLRWQAADGSWVELHGSYLSAADGVVDTLPRIAEKVTTGRQAVRLPFEVRDVPAGFTPVGVNLQLGAPAALGFPWSAGVTYRSGEDYLGVELRPDGEPATPLPEPRPVPAGTLSNAERCAVARGVKTCARATGSEDPFGATGGLAGWLERVTPLGTDQAGWTTDVVH